MVNVVAQFQILNKVLETGDYSIIINNNLTKDYFFDYTAEFEYIKNHYEKYDRVPDKLTFKNIFTDFQFTEVTEPDSFLVSELTKQYKAEFLRLQFNEMKQLLESGQSEKAEKLFKNAYDSLSSNNVGITCVDLFQDTSRYDHYLDKTKDKSKYYISTGLPELDQAIGGIDRQNENLVIAARTGIGKTQLLVKMAVEASRQGLNVGFYEGEMSQDKIGARVDTMFGNIQNTSINRGDLFIQKEYEQYIKSLPGMNCTLKVLTSDMLGRYPTVSDLRAFIKKYNLDILFIDQYSLMEDESKYKTKNRYEAIANIAKDIKNLQVLTQIPIISVSQMNRTGSTDENGKKADPNTTQIAGSDMISQYGTTILMLEKQDKVLTIHISKARDGALVDKLKYSIDFNVGTFNYIPVEGDTIATEEDYKSIEDSYSPDAAQPQKFEIGSEDMPW